MSSKMEISKVCECCGNTFIAQKTTTRYCSHKCNSKAYKQGKREFKMVAINYSTMQEIERISDKYEKIKDKEYLSVSETAFLLGIERTTVYRYLHKGTLKAVQTNGKSFIRRSDIDEMFANAEEYESKAKPSKEPKPLTELYTVAEIKGKFNIKESWLYKIARENNIPKTLIRGKSYFSKEHIDKYFEKKGFNESQDIKEWYSVEDIQEKYNLSTAAIYSFVSEQNIPRKKDGRKALYSKKDFDIAKGYEQPQEAEYYTTEEAMQKFNLTRDALYHYVKYHNIPKIKEGRYVKISKPDLDKLFNPQILCNRFRDYLMDAKQLKHKDLRISQNSASGYFSTFRVLLKVAYKEKFFRENLNDFLDSIETTDVKKKYLTLDEVKLLANTPCYDYPILKTASLFSCMTGLRISDILKLDWKEIEPASDGGYCMRLRTEKTETETTLPISDEALDLCGKRGKGKVFKGLQRSMTQQPLKAWVASAGITKHITFHCFRHTFATLQIALGTDIYTVSKMLTHKNVSKTQIYADLVSSKKRESANKISLK